MAIPSLLTRIVLALSAVSAVSLGVSVGGCSSDDDAPGTGTTGGSGAGGAGGTSGACRRELGEANTCYDNADCPAVGAGVTLTCFQPGRSSCDGLGGEGLPTCTTTADCATQGFPADYLCQQNGYPGHSSCASACTTDDACAPSHACNVGTGLCEPRSCDTAACPTDSFCTDAKICAYQSCNDARPCGEGLSCSSTNFTCVPTPCTGQTEGECSPGFACDLAAGTCSRRTCTCDTDCQTGGFCIGGSCFTTPGHCDGGCVAGRPLVLPGGEIVVASLVRGVLVGPAWT
jgi:hypothetical protein